MTSGRVPQVVRHLLLVWVAMAVVGPVVGVGVFMAGWGGGGGAALVVAGVGVPVVVGLLVVLAPEGDVVPWCGSRGGRVGWAVTVFLVGTAGVAAGVGAYGGDVDLGGPAMRVALVGVPYAVVAAFFVPGRWVRAAGVGVLAAGVAYGGFVGPAQARERERAAEVAAYREHPEVLYVIDTPPGMRMVRATIGVYVSFEYHSLDGSTPGYVGLTVRSPLSQPVNCAVFTDARDRCTREADGDVRVARGDGTRSLFRRHLGAEAEISSRTLDDAALNKLLGTLHPVSDGELDAMMREGVIGRL
ncbi:hypothetical protein IAG44_22485 [Streptomyces roseirectus]|uniref:Uncharacterized protein n=1 Tax=Streptomyces roseirectus TaxID=2768066 RepID=A0A7H0IGI9_9ACTN|nr:hypothetical protein [Streptomyces roseirectus]QNP71905.1 hypothetical protein IAG44_22485 [Streptomyces roseirectus]